jgi:superfamily II DNA or RNA helicase/HKD family nuclease
MIGRMSDTLAATAPSLHAAPLSDEALSSIIDNLGANTLLRALERRTENGIELSIATAFFSLDALNLLGPKLKNYSRIRLLFGDDASPKQRIRLLQALRERSDADLLKQRDHDAVLSGLIHAHEVLAGAGFEARCYTRQKFHAKAYLVDQGTERHPPLMGVLGSGNFTRPGLTQNVELNVDLTIDQCAQLRDWFNKRWEEAAGDVVTDDVRAEITRQISLVEPHAIYLKSLMAWGDYVQGRDELPELALRHVLDPHQEDAYRQALNVIARENGVMICDGVGLGKSFVALALMEHYCRLGKRVLLVAPKAILDNSWNGYLDDYLADYKAPFGHLHIRPMTFFGFPAPPPDAEPDAAERELRKLAQQADVIVVDESHNFRTTAALRYLNLARIVKPTELGRKKVILLTATPINTDYADITAQFSLITSDDGTLGGHSIRTIRTVVNHLDRETRAHNGPQPSLFEAANIGRSGALEDALQACVIQRSRKTCKELAAAAGKVLRFPDRDGLKEIKYDISPMQQNVVDEARQNFEELAKFLAAYKAEVKRAGGKEKINRAVLKLPKRGLRFSAYLPDRYRKEELATNREAQVESMLASLVYVNVMKQLESSIVAFQGILQSLGAGLCARLDYVFGESVAAEIAPHREWINTALRFDSGEEEVEDADDADLSGEEMDDWVERALKGKGVRKGLAGFSAETHNVDAWRVDILRDLAHLEEIHQACVTARQFGADQKLLDIADCLRQELAKGRKCLVFTQSKRTARYLESELPGLLNTEIARIDSDVASPQRKAILHAFSPTYNPFPEHKGAGKAVRPREVQVLVSTDVLSEGVNLQEAGCILNYDIHWNPVRLIQRIGRVDRRLNTDAPPHSFTVYNVFPPAVIEKIIKLVGTVEARRHMISRTLGIDISFLRENDEEGTLREFNRQVDGEITAADRMLIEYRRAQRLSAGEIAKANAVPAGGFGVWRHAPAEGLFALLTIRAKEKAAAADLERFKTVIGRPVLALRRGEEFVFNPAEILDLLSATRPGEPSADPRPGEDLTVELNALRAAARRAIRDLGLTQGFELALVCWLELRPRHAPTLTKGPV